MIPVRSFALLDHICREICHHSGHVLLHCGHRFDGSLGRHARPRARWIPSSPTRPTRPSRKGWTKRYRCTLPFANIHMCSNEISPCPPCPPCVVEIGNNVSMCCSSINFQLGQGQPPDGAVCWLCAGARLSSTTRRWARRRGCRSETLTETFDRDIFWLEVFSH
eukprot:COSAG04_NODE_2474_length_4061_cov_26.333173_7_plen_164_part_00